MNDISFSKTETEVIKPRIDFSRLLETVWRPGRQHSAGDYVRPTRANGFEYECVRAGQTGAREPKWPESIGEEQGDGSVTWNTLDFGLNATDLISSVNVDTEAGITVSSAVAIGNEVSFKVSGGEIGRSYEISIEITTYSDEIIEKKLSITVVGE